MIVVFDGAKISGTVEAVILTKAAVSFSIDPHVVTSARTSTTSSNDPTTTLPTDAISNSAMLESFSEQKKKSGSMKKVNINVQSVLCS